MNQSRQTLVALLLWLVAAPLAEAFYNPKTGRWLNRDLVEEKGGLNVFSFVRNNSINLVDLLGLYSCGISRREATLIEDILNYSVGAAAQTQWAYGPKMSNWTGSA